MEKKVKVSAILPLYKNEKYLAQCIDSVVNQSLKDIEIILCDKKASPKVTEIINSFADRDSRIKILSFADNGYGASVNRGIKAATGEYIAIIESDDFISSTMFEEMYNYAKQLDSDVVKCTFFGYQDNGQKNEYPMTDYLDSILPKNRNFTIKEYPQLLSVHASIWAALYKRKFLLEKSIKVVEANGAGYVDVGFRIDTLTKADSISWLRKAFYYYRTSNNDSSTTNWNPYVMLTRWNEVHKSVNNEDYAIWGPYTFADEYLNTFYRQESYKSKECLNLLKENLSYIPETVIDNAIFISDADKKFVKDLKRRFESTLVKRSLGKIFSKNKNFISKILNVNYCEKVRYPAIISMLAYHILPIGNCQIKTVLCYTSFFCVATYFFGIFCKCLNKLLRK